MVRLIVILTTLTLLCIISLTILLKPCGSQQIQAPMNAADRILFHGLPRKLKLSEEVTVLAKGHAGQESRFRVGHSGNDLFDPKGTTWAEADEISDQVFTMDYTKVQRRRPIHNKSLPSASAP